MQLTRYHGEEMSEANAPISSNRQSLNREPPIAFGFRLRNIHESYLSRASLVLYTVLAHFPGPLACNRYDVNESVLNCHDLSHDAVVMDLDQ